MLRRSRHHGLRETWKKSRTQRINLLRGILREAGIEAPTTTAAFLRAAPTLVDGPELAPLRSSLHIVLAEIALYEQCMGESEQQLKRWHAEDAIVRKLDEVSDRCAHRQRPEGGRRPARALRQWSPT